MSTCRTRIESLPEAEADSATHDRPCGRRSFNAVIAVFTVLMFSGCRVGPDAVRPLGPWLQDHYSSATALLPASHSRTVDLESDASSAIPSGVNLACWWDDLNDPCLNQLIAEVSHENYDLSAAYFRIAEARGLTGAVQGRFFPTLDHKSSYAHRKNSINGTQFGSPLSQPFDFYSTGFDSTWEIDLFGKIQRSMESAQAKADATKEAYAALRLTLLAEVATNYVNYRVIQARLRIAEQNEESQRSTLQLVSKRLKAGLAVPLDEAQAESNLYSTSATVPSSRQDLVKVRNRICTLVGNTPSDEMDLFLGDGPVPEFSADLSLGVPCDLLRRRPDIRQAEFTVVSACADIGVATAELYPQLSLKGDISVDSRQYTNLFASDSLTFGVGPSLRWKLLYWGSIRQNIKSREAAHQQTVAKYKQTVLNAVEEVENALVSYHNQAEREVILQQAVDATQRTVTLSQSRYESGLVTFQPVLDSQRELFKRESELIESRGAKAVSLIQAYKASGGGWAATPKPSARSVTIVEIAPQAQESVLEGDLETRSELAPSTEAVDEATEVLESPIR